MKNQPDFADRAAREIAKLVRSVTKNWNDETLATIIRKHAADEARPLVSVEWIDEPSLQTALFVRGHVDDVAARDRVLYLRGGK